MSAQTNTNQPHPAVDADQLVSVISDVEKQLGLLKTLKEERELHRVRLAAMNAELEARERKLADHAARLEADRADLDARRQALDAAQRASDDRQSALDSGLASLQQGRDDLARQAAALKALAADLDRQKADLAQQRQALEALAAELAQREQAVAAAQAQMEAIRKDAAASAAAAQDATARADQRAAEAAQLKDALAAQSAELDRQRAASAQLEARLADATRTAAAADESAARHAAEADALRHQAAQHAKDAEDARAAAEIARIEAQHLQAGAAAADQALSESRRALVERDAKIQFLSQRVTTILAERDAQARGGAPDARKLIEAHEHRAHELETTLASRDSRIAELTAALEAAAGQARQAAALEARLAELEAAAAESEERLAQMAASLDDARAAATGQATAAAELTRAAAAAQDEAAQLESLRDHLAQLEDAIAQRDRRIAELTASLDEAPPAPAADPDAQAEFARLRDAVAEAELRAEAAEAGLIQLRERLEQQEADAQARVEDLTRRLESAAHAAPAADVPEELRRAQEALVDLADRYDRLREENRALRDRAAHAEAAAEGQIPVHIGQAIATRRHRLRLLRALLSQQSAKLAKASDAMRQRLEQCEQILAQRDALLKARATLADAQRHAERLQARASKVKALAGAFYLIALLAALAGLSWGVAGVVREPVYAVRTTIAVPADHAGTPEQLAEWRAYNVGLLQDPAFLDSLAERMLRNGFASLATAPLLTDWIRKDVAVDDAAPGRIELQTKGPGAGRTERTLQTLASAMLSEANRTKDRRADALDTELAAAPQADPEPLVDQRPIYAAGIFAALAALTLLTVMVAARRMAASKARFEALNDVDASLDAAAWRTMPVMTGQGPRSAD